MVLLIFLHSCNQKQGPQGLLYTSSVGGIGDYTPCHIQQALPPHRTLPIQSCSGGNSNVCIYPWFTLVQFGMSFYMSNLRQLLAMAPS